MLIRIYLVTSACLLVVVAVGSYLIINSMDGSNNMGPAVFGGVALTTEAVLSAQALLGSALLWKLKKDRWAKRFTLGYLFAGTLLGVLAFATF